MQICVDMPSGRTLELELETTETVKYIKTKIQDSEGIPSDQQRLLFAGKQLKNCSTILDCSIKNNSTLCLERKQFS